MTELPERDLAEYETDLRFGEPSPKPKARPYEEAKAPEAESRSYKDKNARDAVMVNPERARQERTTQKKSFDGAKIEKQG